jgi:hypothetical protein
MSTNKKLMTVELKKSESKKIDLGGIITAENKGLTPRGAVIQFTKKEDTKEAHLEM